MLSPPPLPTFGTGTATIRQGTLWHCWDNFFLKIYWLCSISGHCHPCLGLTMNFPVSPYLDVCEMGAIHSIGSLFIQLHEICGIVTLSQELDQKLWTTFVFSIRALMWQVISSACKHVLLHGGVIGRNNVLHMYKQWREERT